MAGVDDALRVFVGDTLTAAAWLGLVITTKGVDLDPAATGGAEAIVVGGRRLSHKLPALCELGPEVRRVACDYEEIAGHIDGDAFDMAVMAAIDGAAATPARDQVPGGIELLHHVTVCVRDVDVAGGRASGVVNLDVSRGRELSGAGAGDAGLTARGADLAGGVAI